MLSRLRSATAVVAIAALSACSGHVGVPVEVDGVRMERIYHDNGGHAPTAYADWIERAEKHDIRGYIVDGPCVSFCVFMAFYSDLSCYTPSASLGIHLATNWYGGRDDKMNAFNEKLLSGIPQALADEIRKVDNFTAFEGRDIRYDELKQIMPDRECPKAWTT